MNATVKLLKDIGGKDGIGNEAFQAAWPKDEPVVDLVINSCGGSCVEGIAIAEFIRAQREKGQIINAKIQGFVGSISTIIGNACTASEISPFSQYFIHEARVDAMGATSADLAAAQAEVDVFNSIMKRSYMEKTKLPEDQITALMSASTMMTAQRAVELGFVDKMTGIFKAVAMFYRDKPESEGHIIISINQAEDSPGAVQEGEAEMETAAPAAPAVEIETEEAEEVDEEKEAMKKKLAEYEASMAGLSAENETLKNQISANAETVKKSEAMAKKLGGFVPPPKPESKAQSKPSASAGGNLVQLF